MPSALHMHSPCRPLCSAGIALTLSLQVAGQLQGEGELEYLVPFCYGQAPMAPITPMAPMAPMADGGRIWAQAQG